MLVYCRCFDLWAVFSIQWPGCRPRDHRSVNVASPPAAARLLPRPPGSRRPLLPAGGLLLAHPSPGGGVRGLADPGDLQPPARSLLISTPPSRRETSSASTPSTPWTSPGSRYRTCGTRRLLTRSRRMSSLTSEIRWTQGTVTNSLISECQHIADNRQPRLLCGAAQTAV